RARSGYLMIVKYLLIRVSSDRSRADRQLTARGVKGEGSVDYGLGEVGFEVQDNSAPLERVLPRRGIGRFTNINRPASPAPAHARGGAAIAKQRFAIRHRARTRAGRGR